MQRRLLLVVCYVAMVVVNNAAVNHTKYAAFSVLNPSTCAGLDVRVGRAVKHPRNPLFGQDRIWEPRMDNGYANVIHDPSDPEGEWRLWYDCFTKCNDEVLDDKGRHLHCGYGSREHSALYARSKDGLTWEKPDLGIVNYILGKGMVPVGTPNSVPTNILFPKANGMGMYKDMHDTNVSRRFKAFGQEMCGAGGIKWSADGLNFTDCVELDIPNVHWDTWANMFYDERSGEYIGTMRADRSGMHCGDTFYPSCNDHLSSSCTAQDCLATHRMLSRVHSTGDDFRTLGTKDGNVMIMNDEDPNRQLYVQSTFPYLNVYLGIVDVYNAATMRQEVHCELTWSPDGVKWYPVERGVDLIPLGEEGSFESHICYGSIPVWMPDGTIRVYYFGGDGPHFGVRNSSLALATFRPDGLAALGAPHGWVSDVVGHTIPLVVTGSKLYVSADTDIDFTEKSIVVPAELKISAPDNRICSTVKGVNVTDYALGGCSFQDLVGKETTLRFEMTGGALLYSFMFSD